MRNFLNCVLAVIAAAAATPARAALINETLTDVAFRDGGIATGFFIFDTSTGKLTSWSISVSGGDTSTFPAFTYTQSNSNPTVDIGDLGLPLTDFEFLVNDNSPDPRNLRILLENSLPTTGGSDPLHIWPAGDTAHASGFECFDCVPFRLFSSGSVEGTVVSPEPATLGLVGVLLASSFIVRKRGSR